MSEKSQNLETKKSSNNETEDMNKIKEDKYLTEIKEFPPYHSREESKKESENIDDKEKTDDTFQGKNSLQESSEKSRSDLFEESQEKSDFEVTKADKKLPVTYKDIILGIVNFISIVIFVIILINFPKKSQELKKLKIEEIRNSTVVGLEISEIEAALPKTEEISQYFLDESGVVNFVNDIELLRTEGGSISKVTFASQKAVTDKTGNMGIPIVVELVGNWYSIDNDLQKIDKLPYLFRPVKVEVSYDEEDPQMVIYKYGIILYVR